VVHGKGVDRGEPCVIGGLRDVQEGGFDGWFFVFPVGEGVSSLGKSVRKFANFTLGERGVGTLVTESTKGCFCATVSGVFPLMLLNQSNFRMYPSLPPVNIHRIQGVAQKALMEVAWGAAT